MTKKSKNKECFISCLKNHVLVHINCSYFNEFVLAFIYLLLIAMTFIGVSLMILFEYFFVKRLFHNFCLVCLIWRKMIYVSMKSIANHVFEDFLYIENLSSILIVWVSELLFFGLEKSKNVQRLKMVKNSIAIALIIFFQIWLNIVQQRPEMGGSFFLMTFLDKNIYISSGKTAFTHFFGLRNFLPNYTHRHVDNPDGFFMKIVA